MPPTPIELTSFGYLHQPTGTDGQPVPPTADRTEDVRERLRDPAAARNILDLDGRHPDVQAIVLATPGAPELLDNLTAYAAGSGGAPDAGPPHRTADGQPRDAIHAETSPRQRTRVPLPRTRGTSASAPARPRVAAS
ncbi:hypothetical protein ACIPSA_49340 [Streptomyces sp. NPDC086549]|uniref:RapZ C-terminal domain-containing protein n=1 Tax=Streptomyces sp. NPDC086549 TaxID=3365752 RepID=UPI0037FACB32